MNSSVRTSFKSHLIKDFQLFLDQPITLPISGSLYEAYSHSKGLKAIIQVFSKKKLIENSLEYEKAFEILKRTPHKNILQVIDCYNSYSNFYIVYEKNDDTMMDFIKKLGSVSEQDALGIIVEFSKGLLHLKHHKLLPCYFTADHLVIVNEKLKIGWCESTRYEKNPAEFWENIVYKAPELLENKKFEEIDFEKTSVWSLGVLLYRLVTGEYPFEGDSKEQLLLSIKKDLFKIEKKAEGFRKEIKWIILNCLEYHSLKRPNWEEVIENIFGLDEEKFKKLKKNWQKKMESKKLTEK